jgi:hypothetical protein
MPIEIEYDPRTVRELLTQDRDLTLASIDLLAQLLPPDEAERWERAFLQGSAVVDDLALRVWAMEIYARFKVAQADHCVPFPGYADARRLFG